MKIHHYKRGMFYLQILLALLVGLLFFNFWYVDKQNKYDMQYLTYSIELSDISQRIIKNIGLALAGIEVSQNMSKLIERYQEFNEHLNILQNGKMNTKGKEILPPSPESIQQGALKNLVNFWLEVKPDIELMIQNKTVLINSKALYQQIQTNLIQVKNESFKMRKKLGLKAPIETIEPIFDMLYEGDSINDDLIHIFNPAIDSSTVIEAFPDKVEQYFNTVNNVRQTSSPVLQALLENINDLLLPLKNDIFEIVRIAKTLRDIQQVGNNLSNHAIEFLNLTIALRQAYQEMPQNRIFNQHSGYIIIGVIILILLCIFCFSYLDNKQKVLIREEKNSEIQREIQKALLDLSNSVQKTIQGMEHIKQQIETTAKSMQRLANSSKEINEIIAFIDDIAEKTNILALNAGIQAAMAGDAGLGFAVVADEVQRLAERSGHAAKEVAKLVHSVQADTDKATTSIEKAITEVTLESEIAYQSSAWLSKIEEVSINLSGLIQNIKNAQPNA